MLKAHYQAVLNEMAPGGVREKYDFGRNTRTQFELSEAGENNLLCDEIQFQLDRYNSASSNELAKISALQALIDIFADKVTKTIKSATRGYIQELFKLLSTGTARNNNANSRFFFALILIICRDTDGSFDHTFNVPIDLTNKILGTCKAPRDVGTSCMCTQSGAVHCSGAGGLQQAAMEAEESGYRRKRKFASALSTITEKTAGGSPFKKNMASKKTDLPSPASSTASSSSRTNNTKPALLRGYGSVKASSSVAAKLSRPVSLLSSAASPVVGAASEYSDNYWFEDEFSVVAEPLAPVPVPVSVPIVQQCSVTGGFHKKRKLANAAKHLPVEDELPAVDTYEVIACPRTVDIAAQAPLPTTNPLCDKLSSIYDTFLCKVCGTDSGGDEAHCQQDELLQLLLVNAYLSAKVQSLASVKLDIFQTAAEPEPERGSEAQADNDTHGAHHPEDLQATQAAGSFPDVQDDGFQGIRSPLDPTCAASSSFYKRQAESLSQFQLAMLNNSDNLQNRIDGPYLHFVCSQLAARFRDLQALPSSSKAECARRATVGKLWLTLGVIDSSCFRCPANQRSLTELEPEHEYTVPNILVQLLAHIKAPLMADIQLLIAHDLAADNDPSVSDAGFTHRWPADSPASAVVPPRSSQPCTPAKSSNRNIAVPPGSGPRHKDASSELPLEWRRFQNLFHEVPIARTRQARDLPSQEGGLHEGEIIHAVIGMPELCTAALKALISVTTDNPSAAQTQLNETDVLSWAVAMLAWCTAWRCCLEESHRAVGKTSKSSSAAQYSHFSRALSPDETRLERFILDMMLHLQSLLRNLTEHSAAAVASACVWGSLQAHEHIVHSLPLQHRAVKQTAADAQFMKSCPLVTTFLYPPEAAMCSPSCSSATLGGLLVEILLLETKEQLRDLEDTDAAINCSTVALAGIQNADFVASPAVPSTPSVPSSAGRASAAHKSAGGKKTASTAKGAVELLPIAELTISAYAALLLQALASEGEITAPPPTDRAIDCDRSGCLTILPERMTSQLTAAAAAVPLSVAIASRLPRGNWWLCSRVLKAFLSLQGQTGIMILDNIGAVSRAVQWMARQDDPAESTAPREHSTADSLYDSPSGNHAPIPTTALVRSFPAKQTLPVDLQERIDFTGEDDFFNDFSAADAAERGAQMQKSSKTSKAGAGKWEWDGSDYVWKCTDDFPSQLTELKQTASTVPSVGRAGATVPAASTSVDRTRAEENAEVTSTMPFRIASTVPVRLSVRPASTVDSQILPVVSTTQSNQQLPCGLAGAGTSGHVKQTVFCSSESVGGNNANPTPAIVKAPKMRASGAVPDATVRPLKHEALTPPLPLAQSQVAKQPATSVAESDETRPMGSGGWRGKRKLSGVQGVSVNAVKK